MGLPIVRINQTNGNLGRKAKSLDGVSLVMMTGVAVGGQFALNDVLGPFFSIKDVEAKGITEAYDATNTCMAWKHFNDFYAESGNGIETYAMVVAKTTTLASMASNTNVTNGAKKALVALNGRIRLVTFTRIPDSGYTPTYTGQLDDDLIAAIAAAKVLRAAEFDAFRPIDIVFEGRDWQGTVGSTTNMRDATTGFNAEGIGVVIAQDPDVPTTYTWAPKYAAAGQFAGRQASIQVQRDPGRVKDGELLNVRAGFSNGSVISAYTDSQLDTLNDFGFIFYRSHSGKAGWYFNDDHAACVITSDYAYLSMSRTANKATRIARRVYVDEILNDIEVDAETGMLPATVCSHFESLIETALNDEMVALGELSGAGAFCDPDQDVRSDDELSIELNLVSKITLREITVTQSYAVSLNS